MIIRLSADHIPGCFTLWTYSLNQMEVTVMKWCDEGQIYSLPIRDPESRPAVSVGQAQPQQASVCGRPLSPVAQEDMCVLLCAEG